MKNYLKMFLGFVFVFSLILVGSFTFTSNALAVDAWVSRLSAGLHPWSSITSDSTGQYLAAVTSGGGCGGSCAPYYSIHTSNDFGTTWTEQTSSGQRNWKSITSNSTGQYLAAEEINGYIYTSNDYGVTWTTKSNSSGQNNWNSIASNSTGQYLAAVAEDGYIYTSNDFGTTWLQKTSDQRRKWRSITSDSTGQYLAAVSRYSSYPNLDYVYTSIDYGVTWTTKSNSSGQHNWNSITSNSTGQYLVAVAWGEYIYTSNDYGATWLQKTSDATRYWSSITSDSTGQYLAAVVQGGYIYTSNDYGVTWLQKTSDATRSWTSITSNSTGQKLAATAPFTGTYNGYIYTYGPLTAPEVTTTAITPINTASLNLNGYVNTDHTIRGFEYGLTTSYGNTTTENGTFGSGNFSATISSITPNVTYHYRSYATNSEGTSYSADSTFVLDPLSWIERTSSGPRYWNSITSNSTGQYLAAVVQGGYIYTSNDYGVTWLQKTSDATRSWRSVTSNSTGQYLAAVAKAAGCGGSCSPYYSIYTSDDFGTTWTEQVGSGQRNWYSITSNSTGQYLAAAVYDGYIYTSNNYGVTWTEQVGSGQHFWKSITSDFTGQYLAAVTVGNMGSAEYIHTSIDYGATWTQRGSSRNWIFITSDSTGQYLAAVVQGGYIYTSNDYGATWLQKTSDATRNWIFITSDSTGQYLAAVVQAGYIYTSNDFGDIWTEQASVGSRDWSSVASSSDGTKLVAVNQGGYIYTYPLPEAPDTTPDSFTLTDQTGIALSTGTESNTITIAGINASTPISISSCTSTLCEYKINSGTYTSTAGTVVSGDTVRVRQTSSSADMTTTNLVLDIGGVTDTFSLTTGDFTAPTLSQITAVSAKTNDNTPNYTFTTNEAGDITYGGSCSSITTNVISGSNTITFDTLSDSTYSNCTITVTDSSHNPSNPLAVNTFTVDTVSPIITLLGITPTNTYVGNTYTDQGATATDNVDGDITSNIVNVNNVDINTVGTYTVTYNVSDGAGNNATEVVRTVNVKRKTNSAGLSTRIISPVVPPVVPPVIIPTIPIPTTPVPTIERLCPNGNTFISNCTLLPTASLINQEPNPPTLTEGTPIATDRILRLRMVGEDVKQLQVYLNTHGYILAKEGIGSPSHETNRFGLLTYYAVMKFQKANDLFPDGVVGPLTRVLMK